MRVASLVLAGLVMLVGRRSGAETVGAPVLALAWYDVEDLLPSGFEAVQEEVDRLFAEAGARLAWRRPGPDGSAPGLGALELPVILLRADPSRARDGSAMGMTRTSDGHQAIWIFLDSVRRALGHDTRPGWLRSPAEERAERLALARVLAHEVIHAVAPAQPHAHDGLMRRALGHDFLTGAGARVDPVCARALRGGLEDLGRLALGGRRGLPAFSSAP